MPIYNIKVKEEHITKGKHKCPRKCAAALALLEHPQIHDVRILLNQSILRFSNGDKKETEQLQNSNSLRCWLHDLDKDATNAEPISLSFNTLNQKAETRKPGSYHQEV